MYTKSCPKNCAECQIQDVIMLDFFGRLYYNMYIGVDPSRLVTVGYTDPIEDIKAGQPRPYYIKGVYPK